MKIKQLGNGGGLYPQLTNSSFLIKNNKEYLLLDCGYNIMTYFKKKYSKKERDKIISNTNTIFISNMHKEHIGKTHDFLEDIKKTYSNFFLKKIIFFMLKI